MDITNVTDKAVSELLGFAHQVRKETHAEMQRIEARAMEAQNQRANLTRILSFTDTYIETLQGERDKRHRAAMLKEQRT